MGMPEGMEGQNAFDTMYVEGSMLQYIGSADAIPNASKKNDCCYSSLAKRRFVLLFVFFFLTLGGG